MRSIPHCYTSVGSIPPKYLIHIMSQVELVSCSAAALRGLVKPNARHIHKTDLLCVWEFLSNTSPEDDLPPIFHDTEFLTKHLKHFNMVRGRPARDLQMPPDWQSGCYELEVISKKQVLVKNKLLGTTKDLPSSFLSRVTLVNNLILFNNWSQKRAGVKEEGGSRPFR